MRGNRLQLNYAHLPGAGGMAVSIDGRYALTGSVDCAVRAHDIRAEGAEPWWVKSPTREPNLHEVPATDLHDKPITAVALAADGKTFATASDDGFVRLFSASVTPRDASSSDAQDVGSELIQACARFGGPARALDFSPTGAFLAAAGDEPGVLKIIMTAQPSTVNVLRATTAAAGMEPVTALAFDPKSDFVATVGGNGGAAVWSVESGACLGPLVVNDRRALCLAWSPDGSQILVGTDNGAVLVGRDTWAFDKLLEDATGGDVDDDDMDDDDVGEDDGGGRLCAAAATSKGGGKKTSGTGAGGGKPTASIASVAWSRNGRYILTARADASVRLWDVANLRVLSSWRSDNAVQCVRWHPTANAFMVLDRIGQWGIVSDIVPSHMPSPAATAAAVPAVKLPTIPAAPARGDDSGGASSDDDGTDDDGTDEDEDDDDEEDVAVRRSKAKELRRRGSSGDEAENQRPTAGGVHSDGSARAELNFDAADLDADDEDDAADVRRMREHARARAHAVSDSEEERERRSRRRKRRREGRAGAGAAGVGLAVALPTAQPSFVPSSTSAPAGDAARRRILCWTLTAAVLSCDENSHNIVEVEFADASRRTIGIKDHFGFSLGCVSETGVLLACPRTKEHSSILSFRPFASWSNNSDWTQYLAPDESALSIALGARFAAVASDQNVVRLLSLSGLQSDVFGVAGRVVTMAALQDKLAVIYAASAYTPELRYQLFEVASSGEVARELSGGALVLSPGSRLEWLGFASDTVDLTAYDSCGCVWMFRGSTWLPMLRRAAKAADCAWLWVAAATSEAVIGAQCFGDERAPPARPRPALRKVAVLAPVVEQVAKNGQSTLEERLFRSRLGLSRASAAKAAAEERFDEDDEEFEEAEEAAAAAAREVDKCLLALMEVACRREQNLRAFDIATRLSSSISLKYAVNLANHYKRAALAGRVEEVHRRRAALEGLEDDDRARAPRPAPPQRAATRASPVTPAAAGADDRESGRDDTSGAEDEGRDVEPPPARAAPAAAAATPRAPVKAVQSALAAAAKGGPAPVNAVDAPATPPASSNVQKRSLPAGNRFAKRRRA